MDGPGGPWRTLAELDPVEPQGRPLGELRRGAHDDEPGTGEQERSAIPPILVAYVLCLGWIRVRTGALGFATGLTEWPPR